MTGALLAAALDYAARGWAAFPVHSLRGDARCTCGDADCKSAAKHPLTEHGRNDATTDPAKITRWWAQYPHANVGIATGKDTGLYVLDVDPRHGGDKTLAELEAKHGKLPNTVEAATGGGGRHLLFKYPGRPVQSVADIAPGLDVRGDGGYIVAPPSLHKSGAHYAWSWHPDEIELADAPEWLLALRKPKRQPKSDGAAATDDAIPDRTRNDTLTRMAGSMRRASFGQNSITAALFIENNARCKPPLDEKEVERIAASVARYAPGPALDVVPWPSPLGSQAFHGIAGEFVALLRPHTESDDAALLVQFLVAVGTYIGRAPSFAVEGDLHYCNLFAVLVGDTSKGRKGTSWANTRRCMQRINLDWVNKHIGTGLSSGEGLVYAVRDPREEEQPLKERGTGKVTEYQKVVVDHGVDDKRLLVVEPEFATVLRVNGREGNTLSALLRTAWDTGNLRTLTKNSPSQATGAHISVLGHITRPELQRYLEFTETANGFGNRFLWICTRRSKLLPDGGCLDETQFNELCDRLGKVLDKAKTIFRLKRDAEARKLWHEVYERLSEGRPGMVGNLTSRAEAQVLRLSMLYAVLDGTEVIRRVHLEAALEVWRYANDSVRYIFGDAIGDPLADKLLRALRASDDGLDREEIRELLGNRTQAAHIERALGLLLDAGLAFPLKLKGTGRPAERWYAHGGNGGKPPPDSPLSSDPSTGEQP